MTTATSRATGLALLAMVACAGTPPPPTAPGPAAAEAEATEAEPPPAYTPPAARASDAGHDAAAELARPVPPPRAFARCVSPAAPDAGRAEGADPADAAPTFPDADAVIASLRGKFKECYQTALNDDPQVQGCVLLKVRGAPDGAVASVSELRREGLTPALSDCIAAALRGARFQTRPQSKGGVLHVPVTFIQQRR